MISTDVCMPMQCVHRVSMIMYLLSQVWGEQNSKSDVHLFDDVRSDNKRQKKKL